MKRTIKTVYFINGKDPRILRSKDANRAVGQCVLHMQINQYGSHVAEVFDEETGELHAQVKRHKSGDLSIWYNRDPADHETRFAVAYIIGH